MCRAPLPLISVVVPVYGCVGCLNLLSTRLISVLGALTNHYEILLVDDASPDNSWEAILELQSKFSEIKGIRLSRNFGQHIAITAGLANSKGEYVVVMDCDLQDPPEIIPEMYMKLQEGYDLVMGRRIVRSHSKFRLLAARTYFWLASRLNKERIDGNYGTFSMLSRKVVRAFLTFNEPDRHYLFILRWLGFKKYSLDYEHQNRPHGSSSYSLNALINHALQGLFFQATVFLRWIVTIGLIFAFSGLFLALYFIYKHFAYGAVAGWTSLAVLLLICTGVTLSSLGVIGIYVGKIFDQIKDRPLYLIDKISEGQDR